MSYRNKIFTNRKIYNLDNSDELFLNAVKENIAFHKLHCTQYTQLLKSENFNEDSLKSIKDLYTIPVIPTLFFKNHEMYSMDENKFAVKVTSSGTKGKKSKVGFDKHSLYYGVRMLLSTFLYHKLISLMPTNYIILGYEPSAHNEMGAVKSAYGVTKLAPALHREYALKDTGTGYKLNIEGIKKALFRYSKMGLPVRFVGFPAYMYYLVNELKESKIKLKLNKKSKVLLGGGWKQFSSDRIERQELYEGIHEVFGIQESNCKEFFSAVEHPISYCDCINHHFHVPIYSRVIIRDVDTLLPIKNGEVGLLSFVTPLVKSLPLVSVVTDDLAVMYDGKNCGCGIHSPYFEILDRAGLLDIRTCAANAADLLGGTSK